MENIYDTLREHLPKALSKNTLFEGRYFGELPEIESLRNSKSYVYMFHGTKTNLEYVKKHGLSIQNNGSVDARIKNPAIWLTPTKSYAKLYGVPLIVKVKTKYLKFIERVPIQKWFNEYVYYSNIPNHNIIFPDDALYDKLCKQLSYLREDVSLDGNVLPATKLPKGVYIAVRGGKHPIMRLLGSKHYGIIDIGGVIFKKTKPMLLHVSAGDGKMVYVKNPLGMKARVVLQELPMNEQWVIIGKVNNPSIIRKSLIQSVGEKYKYHALLNNCEHFVNKMAKGKRFSKESLRVYGIGGAVIAAGAGVLAYLNNKVSNNSAIK